MIYSPISEIGVFWLVVKCTPDFACHILWGYLKNFFQITFSIFLGGVFSKRGYQQAIPLCLPNNCSWDSKTGQYVQTEEERRSLYVVEEALEQLRKIKGKFLSDNSLSYGIILLSLYHWLKLSICQLGWCCNTLINWWNFLHMWLIFNNYHWPHTA